MKLRSGGGCACYTTATRRTTARHPQATKIATTKLQLEPASAQRDRSQLLLPAWRGRGPPRSLLHRSFGAFASADYSHAPLASLRAAPAHNLQPSQAANHLQLHMHSMRSTRSTHVGLTASQRCRAMAPCS